MIQPKQVSAGTGVPGNAEFERFDDTTVEPFLLVPDYSRSHRVVLLQPRLDVLSLSSENDALPSRLPGALIVLTHEVRLFI